MRFLNWHLHHERKTTRRHGGRSGRPRWKLSRYRTCTIYFRDRPEAREIAAYAAAFVGPGDPPDPWIIADALAPGGYAERLAEMGIVVHTIDDMLFSLVILDVDDPADLTPRLIYADYLEERGDPRCEAVRRALPATPKSS